MAALDEVASSSTLHRVVARRGLKLRAAPSLTSAPVGLVPFGAAVAVDVDGAVELEGRKTRVRCTPRGEGYAAGWSTWNPKLLAPDDDADGAAVLARLEAAERVDVTPELAGECCVAAVCKGTHLLPICEALAARVDADDAVGALCASALAFASSARSGFRVAASAGPEDGIHQWNMGMLAHCQCGFLPMMLQGQPACPGLLHQRGTCAMPRSNATCRRSEGCSQAESTRTNPPRLA